MDFLHEIRRESDRFYALARTADHGRRVPSCPDWTIADLVWHLGEVHWFWATDIELRSTEPASIEAMAPARPDTIAEVIAFGQEQADRMIRLLDETPDDIQVWTWAMDSSAHNVGFIRRHQVQEAAVHRWDLEMAATGAAAPLDAAAAADGIDEVLAFTLPWAVHADKPLADTVHLHCTDTTGEWFVHADGRVEPIHAKGAVAIRGTASELLLGLYKRVPLEALDVIGDEALAADFIRRLNTE